MSPHTPSASQAALQEQEELFGSLQQQQQQQQIYNEDLTESNLMAQRAALEALEVGRATLQETGRQREQLERAERLADDTASTLQKANRIVRGMTWSGWMANLVTKPKQQQQQQAGHDSAQTKGPPVLKTEGLPEECRTAVDALQTYAAHVGMLEACETAEQMETCQSVCHVMFQTAQGQLQSLQQRQQQATELRPHTVKLMSDLHAIQKYHQETVTRRHSTTNASTAAASSTNSSATSQQQQPQQQQQRQQFMPPTIAANPGFGQQWEQQDAHLNIIAQNLGELGSIASTLNEEITRHNHQIDTVLTKSDQLEETAKLVTRRTERMANAKSSSFFEDKPALQYQVTIQHVATGNYMAVMPSGMVGLMPLQDASRHVSKACIFGLYQRPKAAKNSSTLFGLCHLQTRKWLGQSLLGSLTCGASKMGRREEWEATRWSDPSTTTPCNGKALAVFHPSSMILDESDPQQNQQQQQPKKKQEYIKLLCASAGFGAGGYLRVKRDDPLARAATIAMNSANCPLDVNLSVCIGGVGLQERERADLWIVSLYDDGAR